MAIVSQENISSLRQLASGRTHAELLYRVGHSSYDAAHTEM